MASEAAAAIGGERRAGRQSAKQPRANAARGVAAGKAEEEEEVMEVLERVGRKVPEKEERRAKRSEGLGWCDREMS